MAFSANSLAMLSVVSVAASGSYIEALEGQSLIYGHNSAGIWGGG